MFKNYIFDLYGTLVDIHTNEKRKFLWEKIACFYALHGASYEPMEFKKEYIRLCKMEEEKLPEKEYPELELSKVFQLLYLNKAVKVSQDLVLETGKVFRLLSMDYIKLYEGVTELLGDLKKAGKKIFLLSNAQRIFTEPEMKMLHIYDCFDGIVLSSDQGVKKPSPKFYQVLLDKYKLDQKESIMIGNDPTADIKGAHDSGLRSLYIHSDLSPKEYGELLCDYSVMDGDVSKIKSFLLS